MSRVLRKLGAPVIDADLVAKTVVAPDTAAWRELTEAFGIDILNEDQTINRRRLGDKVFANPAALDRLNSITHPRILQAIAERLQSYRDAGAEAPAGVVIDAPLLIEAGMVDMVDEVWLVVVDRSTQMERLIARDHFRADQAKNRINAQIPLEEKRRYADVIIDNSGSVRKTEVQVKRLWARVLQQSTGSS